MRVRFACDCGARERTSARKGALDNMRARVQTIRDGQSSASTMPRLILSTASLRKLPHGNEAVGPAGVLKAGGTILDPTTAF